MKAVRTQYDDKQPDFSDAAALDFTGEKDYARQEFKDDADVNILLKRFGVGVPLKQVNYGEQDFNIDLQQALTAVNIAREAYKSLPEGLKAKYPTWQKLLNHIESGNLKIDLTPQEETPRPPNVPPDPAATRST